HAYQCCGHPCWRTSGGPSPASATCTRRPRASTYRCVTRGTTGRSGMAPRDHDKDSRGDSRGVDLDWGSSIVSTLAFVLRGSVALRRVHALEVQTRAAGVGRRRARTSWVRVLTRRYRGAAGWSTRRADGWRGEGRIPPFQVTERLRLCSALVPGPAS